MRNVFMLFVFILVIVIVASCGKDNNYYIDSSSPENSRLFYSGYFLLDGPSSVNCIYLDEKIENVVDIESDCQSLVTVNPKNNTYGQFPTITASNLQVINGEIRYTRNINYVAGNDIEEDDNGSNITGSRRTDIFIKFVNDKLRIRLDIYEQSNNNNLNEIVATRYFNEL